MTAAPGAAPERAYPSERSGLARRRVAYRAHRREGVVRRLLAIARPGRSRLLLAVAAGSLALGSAVGLMAVSAWLISRAAQHPPVLALSVAVVAVRAFAIGRGVFRYAERLVSHDAAFRQLAGLRVRFFRRIEPLAPGVATARRGDLLARLVSDVDTVQDLYLRVLEPVLVSAVVSLAAVLLAAWLLPAAGVVLLVSLAFAAFAVPAATAYAARNADRRTAGVRAELADETVELLRCAPDLIAYDAVDDRLARISAVDRQLTRLARSAASAAGVGAGLAALAVGAAVWLSIVVAVPAVRSGALPGVELAVLVLLPLAAFEAVAMLPTALSTLHRVRASGSRILATIDAPEPVPDPLISAPVPTQPGLSLRAVDVRWPGDDQPTLRGIDLELPPGRRIGVVGETGAGKSTLAAALLRFIDVESGAISLGGPGTGVDVREIAGDDVRKVIGLCGQDAHIFDSTLRENLRLARPAATDADLWVVLDGVRLGEWAGRLSEGLDTFLGEQGARLSGGERQRIALARALLADFPILVLDEPTAHLDAGTAVPLMADLMIATSGRTIVLITHRLAALKSVDEIVVLSGGRIAQRGTYEELVAAPGPFREFGESAPHS